MLEQLGLVGANLRQVVMLIFGTFVSEDLTCISAGVLIHQGRIHPVVGLVGCWLGIFLGDVALWLIGRWAGAAVLRWSWVRRRLPTERLDALGDWLDRNTLSAILAARFLPGTRLPVYLAAGALGRRSAGFARAALLAGLLWTPLLVGATALTGRALLHPLEALTGSGYLAVILCVLAFFVLWRLAPYLLTRVGRSDLRTRLAALPRWEFWPAWMFYAPLIPWILYLGWRRGGLTTITAANPGMPHGGVVGESKSAILSRLPAEWVAPFELLPAGPLAERRVRLRAAVAQPGWGFPLILKPDVGQRGAGVRKIDSLEQADAWLERHAPPLIAQVYHHGPFEAGIFYYRRPAESHGRILSITDKQFPEIVGDGRHTLAQLIRRHPRFRFQAGVFLARFRDQAELVLPAGQRLRLAVAGNHCQGTLFRDGERLLTPALAARIDEIARSYPGFFIGRFDVRYADERELLAGRGFVIIELNGVTSESTNIYDPTWRLWDAYRVLFRQWRLLFEIGAENRRRGAPVSSWRALWRDAHEFYSARGTELEAD